MSQLFVTSCRILICNFYNMYCYIKYSGEGRSAISSLGKIKSEILKSDTSGLTQNLSAKSPTTSHKSVKYEKEELCKNKVIMVNPDCYIQILMDYIYEFLKLDKNISKIDLSTEKGELLKVYKLNPYDSAVELLEYKKTYVVVIYDVDESGNYTRLEPVLNKVTKQDSELFQKILRNMKIHIKQKSNMNINSARSNISRVEVKRRSRSHSVVGNK